MTSSSGLRSGSGRTRCRRTSNARTMEGDGYIDRLNLEDYH